MSQALGALARLAHSHHGVFSTHEARACGVSKDALARAVAAGVLRAEHEHAYSFTAVPLGWQGRLLAACWAGGIRAYASHRSAASLWGLPGGSRDVVELTCPRWRRARHDGLVVHETKAFSRTDRTTVESIPVSTVGRTLLDLGAVVPKATVELALEEALHRRLVTHAEVWGTLRRLGKQGRNGAGVLRHVMLRRGRRHPTESRMEMQLVQELRRGGRPEPEALRRR